MIQRVELQELLETLLGSENVFFQPPNNIQLKYPCIIYERARTDVDHADNIPYRRTRRYTVTLIDRNPDNVFVDAIAALPMCTHDTFFTQENLNHDVFTLYF